MVVFGDEAQLPQLLEGQRIRRTTLTEYFTANRHAAERAAERAACGEQLEVDCRELLYQDVPTKMTWDKKERQWTVRRGRLSTIGRMMYVSPTGGERFFLRLLLTAVRGATSFDHLKTVGECFIQTSSLHALLSVYSTLMTNGITRSRKRRGSKLEVNYDGFLFVF